MSPSYASPSPSLKKVEGTVRALEIEEHENHGLTSI
jgi:hypothetical protein